jgi:hypothetical protein
MANKPKVFKCKWNEDGSAYVLARIEKKDSSYDLVPAQQADVSSIVRRVFRTSDSTLILGPTTITVATAVLDSLSTGSIWDADSTGFNFFDTVPPTAFPDGDTEYRVEYKITMADGFVSWLLVAGTSLPVITS